MEHETPTSERLVPSVDETLRSELGSNAVRSSGHEQPADIFAAALDPEGANTNQASAELPQETSSFNLGERTTGDGPGAGETVAKQYTLSGTSNKTSYEVRDYGSPTSKERQQIANLNQRDITSVLGDEEDEQPE